MGRISSQDTFSPLHRCSKSLVNNICHPVLYLEWQGPWARPDSVVAGVYVIVRQELFIAPSLVWTEGKGDSPHRLLTSHWPCQRCDDSVVYRIQQIVVVMGLSS